MKDLTVKQIREQIKKIDAEQNAAFKRELEMRLKDNMLELLEIKYEGSQLAMKIKMVRTCK